ncbi:mitochondrial pyruvate carrier 2-like isoform X3 [Lycium ferocissimum]|uniref:mitochondrial pyruvate carrier 2-like isoform X3 n=1 Tax=Lycium ferocissimum TaxID=112874 RepID=UPI002815729B|nr:mitochondrial pyruvate carrier 2-like isoform X3 [Lycium ferocissimum]
MTQLREYKVMESIRAYLNSPMGPKTTHFWGPMANWGFVISGMMDANKPPDTISGNMTAGTSNRRKTWQLPSDFIYFFSPKKDRNVLVSHKLSYVPRKLYKHKNLKLLGA